VGILKSPKTPKKTVFLVLPFTLESTQPVLLQSFALMHQDKIIFLSLGYGFEFSPAELEPQRTLGGVLP
jgi:hypothetical protein